MFLRNLIKPLPEDWAISIHLPHDTIMSIENSYALDFREHILSNIDESVFRCLYSPVSSRPNAPVNQLIGAGILSSYRQIPMKDLIKELPANFIHRCALDLLPEPDDEDEDGEEDEKKGSGTKSVTLRNFQRLIGRCVRYRQLTGIDLIHICFDKLFHKIAIVLEIDGRYIRMDSLLIHAYCRSLSRHELLYVCNSLTVKELCARNVDLPEFARHYCESDDRNNVLYRDITLKRENTIARLISDAHGLILFCNEHHLNKLEACEVLTRVFKEQTIEADEKGTYRLRTPEDGGMSSTMVQSPFDLDMTYRCKNGEGSKGYAANLIEAFGGWGTIILGYDYEQNIYSDVAFFKDYLNGCNSDGFYLGNAEMDVDNLPYLCDLEKQYKAYQASLAKTETDPETDAEPADDVPQTPDTVPDAGNLPATEPETEPEADGQENDTSGESSGPKTDENLEDIMKKTLKEKGGDMMTCITDGAFYSAPLALEALKKGIMHIPTNLTGGVTPQLFSKFVFTMDGTSLVKCPAGHAPISCSYNSGNKTCRCCFDYNACKGCQHFDICHPKPAAVRKNKAKGEDDSMNEDEVNVPWVVFASQTKKLRAVCESFRSTEEFSLACRFRNGVETLPSILRRRYGVDHIPVRGLFGSSIRFSFSVAGLNFQKLMSGLERKRRNERLSMEDYTREGRKKKKKRKAV